MQKNEKIFIAGNTGLVGSAISRNLKASGYNNIIGVSSKQLDLTSSIQVKDFFNNNKIDYVFLAAAKVGGIYANNTYPAEFIEQNLSIQLNVIHEAYKAGVKRLLFLGSSCIYPRECPQPIKEEYLLTGPLEPTNRPYALAKIAGIEMCWAYNRQYNTKFLSVMPTNLYGPGDNYNLKNSHVIPALIRKMHQAKIEEAPIVEIWGTGKPKREFLYSDDLADACVYIMNLDLNKFDSLLNDRVGPLINIGSGVDQTIYELALKIKEIVGFKGDLVFNPNQPDGTPRKLLDVSKLSALGWKPKNSLEIGLRKSYEQFLNIYESEVV